MAGGFALKKKIKKNTGLCCEGIAQECYAQCDNKVSGTFKLTR